MARPRALSLKKKQGECVDSNTNFAATALKECSVPLSKVVIVGDDSEEISSELIKMSQRVDFIITSGGIGPTHDDVTIKGISKASNSPLLLNEELVDFIVKKRGKRMVDDSVIKISTVPSNSRLLYLSGEDEWPVLNCGNIFVLPGVPEFFSSKILDVAKFLKFRSVTSKRYRVLLSAFEEDIVGTINEVVLNNPMVQVGSYPNAEGRGDGHRTMITLEVKERYKTMEGGATLPGGEIDEGNDTATDRAVEELIGKLDEGDVVRVEEA